MHQSALKSFVYFKKKYLLKMKKPKIVDLGSLDINGSIKNEINFDCEYIGIDLAPGNNVQIVLKDPYNFPFEDNSVDAITSISTFEHVDFFWESFLEILRVLKPGGLFFLNAPYNGHFHRHDRDNWRFYPDAGNTLSKWGQIKGYKNVLLLESFVSDYSGKEGQNDFVGVFIKDKNHKNNFKDRIIDDFKDFRNGFVDRQESVINHKRMSQDQDNWGWKLFYKLNKLIYKIKKLWRGSSVG
jgi:SAM-dependent methyltransferase